ncbi:MAG: hypothetical protein IPG45_37345 [Deltaproteobacteria bacterium]|nr:hypothetical protein [Deltaproteobacteria bacterium]
MLRWSWLLVVGTACSTSVGTGPSTTVDAAVDGGFPTDSGGAPDLGLRPDGGAEPDSAVTDALPQDQGFAEDAAVPDTGPTGPTVDRTDPQRYRFTFTAAELDPTATLALGNQLAVLDTRAEPLGRLVVYLHGAGLPTNCGASGHADFLADLGFHVLMPCYVSNYGVGNCGADIGGCRLEAFEGVDHHNFIEIGPADAIEPRVVKMLEHLSTTNPEGDWSWFLDQGRPRWSAIVVSGISHGASTSGLIGKYRDVAKVVMLSGPLDTGQAWLALPALTPIERYFGFTHTGDGQHPGHLEAFETLGLPGAPTSIDDTPAPYGGSHRLQSSAPTNDGHGSTQLGGASPTAPDGAYLFDPVWRAMYLD